MTQKIIIAGLVALAFVAGSIMTGTMASAASNAQGAPFKQLQDQIDTIDVEIVELKLVSHEPVEIFGDPDFAIFGDPDVAEIFGDPDFDALFGDPDFELNSFLVDSFFDVFYEINFNPNRCSDPDALPKVADDLSRTDCVPKSEFVVDSFFDVFYDIEVRSEENKQAIDEEATARAADVKALQEQVDMLEEWHLQNTGQIIVLESLVEQQQNRIFILEALHDAGV
jgi:hypothetical protein